MKIVLFSLLNSRKVHATRKLTFSARSIFLEIHPVLICVVPLDAASHQWVRGELLSPGILFDLKSA
jgi:hypothetical protein